MLQEQQEELAEGYRMAAAAKLSAAVGGWRGSALAHAVATWRQASALQSAGQPAANAQGGEAASAALRARLESMSQMIQEQQEQQEDLATVAVTAKLGAAVA